MKKTIEVNFKYLTEELIKKIDKQFNKSNKIYGDIDLELYYRYYVNSYVIDCDKNNNYILHFNLYDDDGGDKCVIEIKIKSEDLLEAGKYLKELEKYIHLKLIQDSLEGF